MGAAKIALKNLSNRGISMPLQANRMNKGETTNCLTFRLLGIFACNISVAFIGSSLKGYQSSLAFARSAIRRRLSTLPARTKS